MQAFGDLLLFLAIFGFLSLAPRGLALYYVRGYPAVWPWLAAGAALAASCAVVALMLYLIGRTAPSTTPLGFWASLTVLRLLPTPVFAALFIVAGALSPHRAARWILLCS